MEKVINWFGRLICGIGVFGGLFFVIAVIVRTIKAIIKAIERDIARDRNRNYMCDECIETEDSSATGETAFKVGFCG